MACRAGLNAWLAPVSSYEFRVLDEQEEMHLNEAVADLPDLEAGVLLLAIGLTEEAVYRFDAAHDAAPNSASALSWRAEAFEKMGLHEDANADLREAALLQ